MTFPRSTVLKTVPLKFAGADLKLQTSHALFSSHHVDDGTMLLLKSLAQQKAIPETGRVLDAGCGYGPLALAIAKHRPGLEVVARDRLALAAAFTADNARINGLKVDAAPGLLLDEPGPWNLIVSNLPAKAGEPVLADFVTRSLGLLAPGGRVAVVIVEPLAAWLEAQIVQAGASVVHREAGPGYQVFHWTGEAPAVPVEPPFRSVYRRGRTTWAVGAKTFATDTFYGLPNFDGLDYRLQLTLPLLEKFRPRGDLLVWEPVQGHLAAWAASALGPDRTLHVAGNDRLGLAAAAHNAGRPVELHPVPTLGGLELGAGSLGAALVQIHSEPEVPWVEEAVEALNRLLAPGAPLLVSGTSTDLTRFLERHKGLRKLTDEREKGWRVVILERQTP